MGGAAVSTEENDPVIRAAQERVALLTRKYAGIFTTEDEARLHVLTERLRRLSPRVIHEDLNRLSTMVDAPHDRSYRIIEQGRAIECLGCGAVSYHPEDVRHRYCGHCHQFHDDGPRS